jgi:hypothetical protein
VTRKGIKTALLASLFLGGAGSGAEVRAQGQDPGWLGGQIYQENDSLIAGDDRYTQGLRFAIQRFKPPRAVTSFGDWLAGRLWSNDLSFDPALALVFGQNLYTPEIITARLPYPGDRRFAGVLYVGGRAQFTEVGQTRRHSFEVDVGLTGSPSLAGAAQSGLHVLRFRRIPKGWDQARDGVIGEVSYRFERRLLCSTAKPCYADFTFGGLAGLGNLQTNVGVHGAVRVGYGITGFPAAAISNTLRQSRGKFEVGAILGWEGRFDAYNGLLLPSLETPAQQFSPERLVSDTRYGGYVRFKDVRFTVLHVERSAEFSVTGTPKKGQGFGSVSVSYEPVLPPDPDEKRGFFWRDWHFQLGLGGDLAGPELTQGGRRGGPSGRIGIAKGLAWDLLAGFELAGAVAGDSPATSDVYIHRDTFLIHRSLTLGWAPTFAKKRLILRAGPTLFGQLAKVETTDNHLESGKPVEILTGDYQNGGRWGWIAGIDYTFPLERHLYMGAGITYTSLTFPGKVASLSGTRFLTGMLSVNVRP